MMKKYDYYYERETECYIRGEKAYNKSDYWGDKAKRLTANFRVYESEFINLTFLNSVFIDYVITTKRIGSYSSTYASLVPMLNSMSRFLKKKEKRKSYSISKKSCRILKCTNGKLLYQIGNWRIRFVE